MPTIKLTTRGYTTVKETKRQYNTTNKINYLYTIHIVGNMEEQ